MAWFKRNLLFVVGLLVAFVLLGIGVWYFMAQKSAADEVAVSLQDSASKLDALVQRKPYPNADNIKLAKADQLRVAAFKTNILQKFVGTGTPEKIDTARFKGLLEDTIARLERAADRSGVKLPSTNYSFTFQDVRGKMQLQESKLGVLASQLVDIDNICRELFDAKIHQLISIKRPNMLTNETIGSEYLTKKPSPNAAAGMTAYPYEVVFQSLSTELGMALSGVANSPHMIVVKWVNIERGGKNDSSDTGSGVGAVGNPAENAAATAMSTAMMMRMRYGMGRGMPTPAPQPTTTPTLSRGAVFDEQPLKITLGIDVIRTSPKSTGPSSGEGAAKTPGGG